MSDFRFSIRESRFTAAAPRSDHREGPQSKIEIRKSRIHRAAHGGFTLVEVLIALAVFAFAAVVLGSAYVNILNSYDIAARGLAVNEDFDFARQLVLTEPDRTKLEQGGEFDTAQGRHAKWTVEITSTNEADVFDVNFNCEIQDPSRPEPDKVTQKFTVLRPTWVVDQAERDKLKEAAKQRILEIQGKQQQQSR